MKHRERDTDSPVIAAIRAAGLEPTLDRWLEWNFETDHQYDAELLEVVPAEFQDEYYDRLTLQSGYNRKLEERALEGTHEPK